MDKKDHLANNLHTEQVLLINKLTIKDFTGPRITFGVLFFTYSIWLIVLMSHFREKYNMPLIEISW